MPKAQAGTEIHNEAQVSPYLILAPFWSIICLYLIGAYFPIPETWGFNIWAVMPIWYPPVVLFVYILLAVPQIGNGLGRVISNLIDVIRGSVGKLPKFVWIVLVSAIALFLFIYFRSQAYVYGDGFLVKANASKPFFSPLVGDEVLKPLSTFIFRMASSVGKQVFPYQTELPLSIVNSIAGIVGLWGIIKLSKMLFPKHLFSQLLMLTIGLSSGCIILFFGYIEHYSWAVASLTWLIVYLIKFIRRETISFTIILLSFVTFLLHMVFFPLLFLVVLLILGQTQPAKGKQHLLPFGFNFSKLAIITGILSIVMALIIQISKLSTVPVPIWPTDINPYWVLSPAHILDVINTLLLVAPLGMALIVSVIVNQKNVLFESDKTTKLIGFICFLIFLSLFWIDPILGAPRDWDLMGIYGFPLCLFGGYLIATKIKNQQQILRTLSLSIITCLVLIIPNLVDKGNPEASTDRLDNFIWSDPHYQESYNKAERSVMWGSVLQTLMNKGDNAKRYFYRRLDAVPSDDVSWINLADIYFKEERYDSSAYCVERANRIRPNDNYYLVTLANVYQRLGEKDKVDEIMNRLETRSITDVRIERIAGTVQAFAGRFDLALKHYRRAYSMRPNEFEQPLNLAIIYAASNFPDSGYYYFSRALPLAPKWKRPDVFKGIINLHIVLKRFNDATRTLETLRREFPNHPLVGELQAKISEEQRKSSNR
jgi:tetratricopeptide (TPR) repeat protein